MCSAEPRNLPIPQSPHNNNNSFSSRLHFTPQQKLNKTGEYRTSNKVTKENVKFHYLPVSTEVTSQRTSEAGKNNIVKPNSVNVKIKTRDKKLNHFKEERDRKTNKSEVDRKYYTSNDSYELDA